MPGEQDWGGIHFQAVSFPSQTGQQSDLLAATIKNELSGCTIAFNKALICIIHVIHTLSIPLYPIRVMGAGPNPS